ncbi:transcriptional regulator [Paenibacillus sp. FSL H7-0357]|uniref:LacI family DNA-binding transcriptional regulator n=1 Tax=unclassified Paenibacillus TaxID=185978 RepID=UPI0004F5E4E7|nr:LacI family DNA-binding transcriptional regulator [Paenibacillus sp. FSL H7-0357]AIQ18511.1 transcriptional regulator [Paenibacillus sp. FSL H7-0357]
MSKFKKIMEMTGYSRATVSRVINQSPKVSPEARNKILRIMRELDYVPNSNAISLSTGRTKQIGLVVASLNEMIMPFVNGFVDRAMEDGYQTIIYPTRGDAATELQAFEDLRSKRVDAIVIVTCVNDPHKLKAYCKYGPIVSWQRMEEGGIPSIAMDQSVGYTLALEHLIGKGHRAIANLFARPNSLNTHSRREAYERTMQTYGMPVLREWYREKIYTLRKGETELEHLLSASGPNAPTAVLCPNDYVAVGLLTEARKRSIDVPGRLAIVGFDNIDLARVFGLTTVDNPIAEQARNAYTVLASQLTGSGAQPDKLEYRLVVRAST